MKLETRSLLWLIQQRLLDEEVTMLEVEVEEELEEEEEEVVVEVEEEEVDLEVVLLIEVVVEVLMWALEVGKIVKASVKAAMEAHLISVTTS
jgi:hypothetical protein